MKLLQGLGFILLLGCLITSFQNCSGSNVEGLSYDSASTSTTTTDTDFSVYVSTNTIAINTPFPIVVSGGTAPYTLTLTGGSGSITNMVYTPTAAGTATILVQDSAGAFQDVNLIVVSTTATTTVSTLAPVYYYYYYDSSDLYHYYFSLSSDYPSGYVYGGISFYTVANPVSPKTLWVCYSAASTPYNYIIGTYSECASLTVYKIFGYVESAATSTASNILYRCQYSDGRYFYGTYSSCVSEGFTASYTALGYIN